MIQDDKQIKKIIDEIKTLNVIQLSDIPNIDLYMDQVTTFMEDQLGDYKRNKNDKVLTKTMINNYTKSGIIPPPIKKKYSKDHMILLIFIYHLKYNLSINDIQSLLSPLIAQVNGVDDKALTFSHLYNSFLEIQQNESEELSVYVNRKMSAIKQQFDEIEIHNKEILAKLFMIFSLLLQANAQKRLAEKMIDELF